MPGFSQCGAEYACDSPSKLESSEARAHFTAQSLPTWGMLGRMDLSSCPSFPMVNPFSPIVWIWLSFIMAKVLRLPANAICLQAGDVRHLPKRTAVAWNHSKSRWEAGPCCRQGRAWFPAEELDFSPWIPSWHLREGFCLYKVGQVWALDHPLSLVHSKPRNKASLEAQPCQTWPGVFSLSLFFFFFEFKGNIKVN